jgi:hypothetical protein
MLTPFFISHIRFQIKEKTANPNKNPVFEKHLTYPHRRKEIDLFKMLRLIDFPHGMPIGMNLDI